MAALRMTAAPFVRLLQMQGPRSEWWRNSVLNACAEKGWRYLDAFGPPPEIDRSIPTLFLGWNADPLPEEPSQWVILNCPPSDALRWLEADGFDFKEACYHAAARFAQAAALARDGAPVLDQNADSLDVPGLGMLAGPPEGLVAPCPEGRVGPLSIYENLRDVSPKGILLDPDLFTYPIRRGTDSGTHQINMLGRRRLLFNGPHIALPPGNWSLRCEFDIDCDGRPEILIEWGFGDDVASLMHVFAKSGRYAVELTHAWRLAAPADFRMSLMTPVLDGRLNIRDCVLTAADPAAPESGNVDFADAIS